MSGMIITKWSGKKPSENNTNSPVFIDEMNDPFARQKLVSWWDQEKIEKAKVLVMGAGAIGNETLHNLALLGFRNLMICDMDTIELSNLSRTLLFRREDEGRKKAEVAALRTREMCLAENPNIDFFCGDIMHELGTGVFNHFDIILGCLDNDATRFFIDKYCTMFGKPWINAGISELSTGISLIYQKETGSCFHCGVSPDVIARVMSRRASCGKTAIADLKAGKVPTVQVASAIVSGIQCQEAVKYICGKPVAWGRNLYYQGVNHSFEMSVTRPDGRCRHHSFSTVDKVTELPSVTQQTTMRELLKKAKVALKQEGKITVDLSEENGRDFIKSAGCSYCGESISLRVPRYKFRDEMSVCEACKSKNPAERGVWCEPITESVRCYSEQTEAELLDLTLGELGIPPLHVLPVWDENENVHYVEMTGDLPLIMPNIFGRKEQP